MTIINGSSVHGSAFQQGVAGMQASSQSMLASANEIVRVGTLEPASSSHDIVEPLINSQQQLHVFTASAKVVDIADKALGALIDITT